METVAKIIKYVLIGISVIYFPILLLSNGLLGIIYGIIWLAVYNYIKKKKAEKQHIEQLNKTVDEMKQNEGGQNG